MTLEEFKKEMEKIFENDDYEARHGNADGLMCMVLEELGYDEGVTIFEEAEKYYT